MGNWTGKLADLLNSEKKLGVVRRDLLEGPYHFEKFEFLPKKALMSVEMAAQYCELMDPTEQLQRRCSNTKR